MLLLIAADVELLLLMVVVVMGLLGEAGKEKRVSGAKAEAIESLLQVGGPPEGVPSTERAVGDRLTIPPACCCCCCKGEASGLTAGDGIATVYAAPFVVVGGLLGTSSEISGRRGGPPSA